MDKLESPPCKITLDLNKVVYAQYFNEVNKSNEQELNLLREPVFRMLTSTIIADETMVTLYNNNVTVYIEKRVGCNQTPIEPHIFIGVKYRNPYPNCLMYEPYNDVDLYGKEIAIDLLLKTFYNELKNDYRSLKTELNEEKQTLIIFYPTSAMTDKWVGKIKKLYNNEVSSAYDNNAGDY